MCARQYLKHFMWCGAIGFKCCGFFCVERQKNTRTDSFFIAINHIISDLILSLHNCIFAFSSSSSASFSFWSNDTVFAKWTIFFFGFRQLYKFWNKFSSAIDVSRHWCCYHFRILLGWNQWWPNNNNNKLWIEKFHS